MDEEKLRQMKVAELKAECASRGLETTGTKAVLIKRVLDVLAEDVKKCAVQYEEDCSGIGLVTDEVQPQLDYVEDTAVNGEVNGVPDDLDDELIDNDHDPDLQGEHDEVADQQPHIVPEPMDGDVVVDTELDFEEGEPIVDSETQPLPTVTDKVESDVLDINLGTDVSENFLGENEKPAATGQNVTDQNVEDLKETKKHSTPKNLWISNISTETRAADLKTIFSGFGKVICAKIVVNVRSTDKERECFGFVKMASAEDAANCIEKLHGTEINGKVIAIETTDKEPGVKKSSGTAVPPESDEPDGSTRNASRDRKSRSNEKKEASNRSVSRSKDHRPVTSRLGPRQSRSRSSRRSPRGSDRPRSPPRKRSTHRSPRRDARTPPRRVSPRGRSPPRSSRYSPPPVRRASSREDYARRPIDARISHSGDARSRLGHDRRAEEERELRRIIEEKRRERERIAYEREKERIAQEKERFRLEEEKNLLMRQRLEREKIEKERLKLQREILELEKERKLEEEKLEKERHEAKRIEKLRIEREKERRLELERERERGKDRYKDESDSSRYGKTPRLDTDRGTHYSSSSSFSERERRDRERRGNSREREPRRSPVRDSKRSPIRDSRRSPVRETRRSPLRDGRRSPLRDSRRSPVRDSRRSPVRDSRSTRAPVSSHDRRRPTDSSGRSGTSHDRTRDDRHAATSSLQPSSNQVTGSNPANSYSRGLKRDEPSRGFDARTSNIRPGLQQTQPAVDRRPIDPRAVMAVPFAQQSPAVPDMTRYAQAQMPQAMYRQGQVPPVPQLSYGSAYKLNPTQQQLKPTASYPLPRSGQNW